MLLYIFVCSYYYFHGEFFNGNLSISLFVYRYNCFKHRMEFFMSFFQFSQSRLYVVFICILVVVWVYANDPVHQRNSWYDGLCCMALYMALNIYFMSICIDLHIIIYLHFILFCAIFLADHCCCCRRLQPSVTLNFCGWFFLFFYCFRVLLFRF